MLVIVARVELKLKWIWKHLHRTWIKRQSVVPHLQLKLFCKKITYDAVVNESLQTNFAFIIDILQPKEKNIYHETNVNHIKLHFSLFKLPADRSSVSCSFLNSFMWTAPWNHIAVCLMKEWLCSSTHYLQSVVSLPMWLWRKRPKATEATGRDWFTSQKYVEDMLVSGKTWCSYLIILLHYWSPVLNLKWGYRNK